MSTHIPTQSTASRVTMTRSHLTVTGWATSDVDVLAAAQAAQDRGDDLEEWLAAVLRAGAVAAAAVSGSADLARLERSVTALTGSLTEQVNASLAGLQGRVTQAVDPKLSEVAITVEQQITRLAHGLQGMLVGQDAVVPRALRAGTEQALHQALAEIQRALATNASTVQAVIEADRSAVARDLTSALTERDAEVRVLLGEVRQALTVRAVATAAARSGPHRGWTYEQAVQDLLSRVAAADGGAMAVGTTTGATGRKVGDIVIELTSTGLTPAPLIVAECKDRTGPSGRLSPSGWVQLLLAARQARAQGRCSVALGVMPPEQLPGGAGRRIVVLDSSSILLGWDQDSDDDTLATAAYALLRLAAVNAATPTEQGLDARSIEAGLRQLAQATAPLDIITAQSAAARRAADKISSTAVELQTSLGERIQAMQQQLTRTT